MNHCSPVIARVGFVLAPITPWPLLAGAEDAVVEIIEQRPGQWTMLDESIAHERPSADRTVWQVELAAGEEQELHYRVEIRH